MSIRASASNLVQATKELKSEWTKTRESWRDIKAQEFERAYLEDLPNQVARTAAVIEELEVLLRKVKTDCE